MRSLLLWHVPVFTHTTPRSGYEPDGYGGYYSDPYPLQDNYYSGGDEYYGERGFVCRA